MKKNEVFNDKNLKQKQFIDAVLSAKYSVLVFGGAIRGGKTFVGLAVLILLCKIFPKSRWVVVRRDLKRLKENTRPSLDKFIEGTTVDVNESSQTFTFANGSKIIFKGENYDKDKTLESFKGLECNGFLLEEVSEIKEITYRKCIERAGSYVIKPDPKAGQPPPLIIMTCNPTQTWVKAEIYDKWKNGTLPPHIYYLPSYVTDNAMNLSEAYIKNLKNLPKYEYEVFVLGNWDITLKTKDAFWHSLDVGRHITGDYYDSSTTLHVSIDSNAMPYCTATIWQVFPSIKKAVQIHEIIARDPHNHATGLAGLVLDYLDEIEYNNVVYVYGDATTKNQNTIDEKKRSFFSIFVEEINKKYKTSDCIAKRNPSVALTGEFVNALYTGYDGWELAINETCKESLSDYLSVKKDMDGSMQKKRVTDENGSSYEEYGHCSDTKRYFLYECLNEVFSKWENRFSEPEQAISVDFEFDNLDGF